MRSPSSLHFLSAITLFPVTSIYWIAIVPPNETLQISQLKVNTKQIQQITDPITKQFTCENQRKMIKLESRVKSRK